MVFVLSLGQEIYKEFDYFIRFLHHRVLKVRKQEMIFSKYTNDLFLVPRKF